jgi:5-methylcytosine-specific restriction endonuclease McrA
MKKSTKARCQICEESNYLEEHHIHGRKIHDFQRSWNLCQICPNCHSKVHRGDIIIEGWFRTTEGLTLLWHLNSEPSFSGTDSHPPLM